MKMKLHPRLKYYLQGNNTGSMCHFYTEHRAHTGNHLNKAHDRRFLLMRMNFHEWSMFSDHMSTAHGSSRSNNMQDSHHAIHKYKDYHPAIHEPTDRQYTHREERWGFAKKMARMILSEER